MHSAAAAGTLLSPSGASGRLAVGRETGGQLKRVKMTVGLDGLDGFIERQAATESPPSTGVAMPLEVEAVLTDPVDPRRFHRRHSGLSHAAAA